MLNKYINLPLILLKRRDILPALRSHFVSSHLHVFGSPDSSFKAGQLSFTSKVPVGSAHQGLLSTPVMVDETVTKSENDTREYRVLTLKNGLRALLISDLSSLEAAASDDEEEEDMVDDEEEEEDEDEEEEEGESEEEEEGNDGCDKKKPKAASKKLSAAALCIGSGSFSDPTDIPGLAHFLEHMVFMGSEKYPDENEFDAFVKKNGGGNNAYTDCERTVFYFDVQHKSFEGALDRFAQFFIKPLMKKDSVDRELKAVDSEWNMSLTSDTSRKEQLLGSFAKPNHPMSKFMWGNLQSLKEVPESKNMSPYDQLHDFYLNIYSSHYMTLAVQSRDTLDTLEEMVTQIFSDVPHNGKPPQSFSQMQAPFETEEFTKMYKVIPVKNFHQVEITWSLPPLQQHYRSKPLFYIGWLIGHEGKGSILSYLKSKYWALSLNSGNSESGFEHNSTWANFSIGVKLTDDGMSHVYEVVCAIFEYLAMLSQVGPQEWIFKEIQTIEANGFRWREQTDAVDYVESLCENMQLYPPKEYITGDELLFEYDPQAIKQCMSYLQPRKANLMMLSQRFKHLNSCNLSERWFGTKHSKEDIPEEWLSTWESTQPRNIFHLPAPNTYIATDFSLKEETHLTEYPVMLSSTDLSTLWYKKDTKFKVPKAYVVFQLVSPIVGESALSACQYDVFLKALEHSLAEVAYAADVAQLSYEIRGTDNALVIKVNGFNDTLPRLFETIVDHIADFRISQELLDSTVDQLGKVYSNECINPSVLNRDLRLQLLQDRHWTALDKLAMLPCMTQDGVGAFTAALRGKLNVQGFVQGNMTCDDAKKMERVLLDKLGCTALPASVLHEMRACCVPVSESYCRVRNMNNTDNNSVITNYYQHGPATLREAVVNELLIMCMEEPLFDCLRTREQLGYSVYCTNRVTSGILAFSLTVCSQAHKFSVESLNDHMEKFLLEFQKMLQDMTVEAFSTRKAALITLKQCEDTHLGLECDRNWTEIALRTFMFDRLQREVNELESVTKKEVLQWFKSHTTSGGKARKLSVQVVGNVSQEEAMEIGEVSDTPGEGAQDKTPPAPPTASFTQRLDFLPLEDQKQTAITDIRAFRDKCYLYPVSKIVD